MNGFENRLFALMMKWDLIRRWWEAESKVEEALMDIQKKFVSILTTCAFVGFVVFYQNDLTPTLVLVMERLTSETKWIIRDWSHYRLSILKFWHSVNFMKTFIEIDDQEIKLISTSPSSPEYAVEIKNGQFFWPSVSESVGKSKKYSEVLSRSEEEAKFSFRLKDFEFRAKRGHLTVIIGKVASGKSSVIHSILGEMPIFISSSHIQKSGMSYATKGSVGYVGQQPLIFSGTVKSNILADKKFDDKKFKYALKYSCLEQDIKTWDKGLDNNVKQNGSNLSGG